MVDKSTLANPFPGLRSYEYEDHALFFGRDSHILALKNKLLESRFLALIGSSGSGKSSLIKAGLIPSLESSGAQDEWAVVLFKPGAYPVKNLLTALKTKLRKQQGVSAGVDLTNPEWSADTIMETVKELISAFGKNKLLLVIDQFEEIFRYDLGGGAQKEARNEAAIFIQIILNHINEPGGKSYAAITMRSDYLDHCTEFKGLTEAINQGYYLLPKMTIEEVREVITKPVEAKGASISEDLVGNLLQEITLNPDSLPILQHALLRTWNKWAEFPSDKETITTSEYEAIGTMKNSVNMHAEELFIQNLDDRRKVAAEKLFKTLIVSGASDTPVLHPIALSEIVKITGIPDYQLIDVIQVFRARGVSFLSPNANVRLNHESVIDVTVEKILLLWTRLSRWIEEELESAKLYKQLSANAQLYQDAKAGLWVNPELQLGLKWQKDNQPTKEWARRYDPYFERAINYLDYSRKQHEFDLQNQEEKQRKALKQSRYFAILGVGIGIVATVAVLYLTVLQAETRQALKESASKEQSAQTERKRAEEQSKQTLVQSKIAEQQQEIAEQQRLLTDEQRQIALQEKVRAEKKEQEAVVAKLQANHNADVAKQALLETREQKEIVENEKREVVRQKEKVDTLIVVANKQREKADAATEKEKKLRLLAVARSIAIQSYQMPDSKDDISALLALQAYKFNDKESPDIFNALSKVADSKTVMRRHSDVVRTVAINPGHTKLASGSDDGTLKIWNVNDLAQRPESYGLPKGVRQDIRSVLFTSDDKAMIAGSDAGQIFKWKGETGNATPEVIRAHKASIHSLLNVKNTLISVSSDGAVRTWKITDRSLDSIQHIRSGFPILCAKVSPDNKVLMCGSTNGRILSFDLSDLKKAPTVYTFLQFGSQVSSLAFSPDGGKLITSNNYGSLHAWTLVNNALTGSVNTLTGRHTSPVNSIIFSPNGKLMATCSYDGSVHIWNYKDILLQQQPIVIHDYDNWVMGLCFTADSNRLISCGADKSVRVWDINTDQLYAKIFKTIKRNFTTDEWNTYIGKDIEYQKILPTE
jgi:WD40 repeat protein